MPIISLPRFLYFGEGSLDEFKEFLAESDFEKVLIVTDRVIRDLGLLDSLTKILDSLGINYKIFDDVEPEPSFETVDKGYEIAKEWNPDIIIALGGGSVIDAAKAIWVKYEKPDFDLRELSPFIWLGLGKKAKLVAIPTTSGTGSEATIGVVLTSRKDRKKIALGSYEVVPYIAVVDPIFPKSMPQKLTAITGLDALSHCIEAYVSNLSNPFTDALVEKGIEIIFEWLPKVYSDGADVRGRERMHIAATLAGIAFSNSGLGLAHALGHAFGPIFKVPHGFSVGVFLPYVVEFNSAEPNVKAKYAVLGKVIGVKGNSIDELYRGFLEELLKLYEKIDAPKRVRELGIGKEEYFEKVKEIAQNAYEDPDLAFNPISVTPEEIEELLKKAY